LGIGGAGNGLTGGDTDIFGAVIKGEQGFNHHDFKQD
jgi:hypothetical protein